MPHWDMVHIGVVGDFDATNPTHVATTASLHHAAAGMGTAVDVDWIGTDRLDGTETATLLDVDGVVIAPGSPYRSLDGALRAIEHARRRDVPLLGTCGGFQHIVLEYARNVIGFEDAQHAEYDPYGSTLFITPLLCSLAGQTMTVQVKEGTAASDAYGRDTVTEHYYCNFGINPDHLDTIIEAGLTVSGTDLDDEPRILELPSHPFFMATLFVPQTSSTPGDPHPLLSALVATSSGRPPRQRGERNRPPSSTVPE
jgi:CTP synthase (UTP-ammonia lyase)